MFARISGKLGTECLSPPISLINDEQQLMDIIWEKNFLMTLLKREDEMRHSPEIQMLYDKGWKEEGIPPTTIEINMQKQLLKEFGLDPEVGLPIFQSYRSIYENDPDIKDLALYIKYDRSGAGSLRVGDNMPDVQLSTLDGQSVKLSDFVKPDRPLVLVGGSYS